MSVSSGAFACPSTWLVGPRWCRGASCPEGEAEAGGKGAASETVVPKGVGRVRRSQEHRPGGRGQGELLGGGGRQSRPGGGREGQWAPRQDSLLPGRPRAGVPGGRALRVPYEVSFSAHIEPVSSGRELGSQQPNVSRSEVCRSQTPLPVTSLGVLHDSPSSSSQRHTRGPREPQGGGALGTGVTPGGEAMTGIAVRALRKREVNVPVLMTHWDLGVGLLQLFR